MKHNNVSVLGPFLPGDPRWKGIVSMTMKKQSAKKKVAAKKGRPSVKRKTAPTPAPAPAVVAPAPLVNPERSTKTNPVIGLLQRESGATIPESMTATGWQAHSVRGFISGTLRKKQGLTITLGEREDGKRAYHLPAAEEAKR